MPIKTFKGSNNLKSKEIFNSRLIYEGFAYSKGNKPNINPNKTKNFNRFENIFYGRIDQNGIPILPIQSKLVPIEKDVYVLDFVADAYKDFKVNFIAADKRSKLKKKDPISPAMQASRGYDNIETNFTLHVRKTLKMLMGYIKANNLDTSIRKFKDFRKVFQDFVAEVTLRFPVTKTGYLLSRRESLTCSGLAIDLSSMDSSRDQPKYDEFISSPNFQFYLNNAERCGFIVDKNAPWRIVADLASPQMKTYYDRNFIINPLINSFKPASLDDLALLKTYLIDYYNIYVRQNPYYRIVRSAGVNCTSTSRLIRRREINKAAGLKQIKDSYLLELYAIMLNNEFDLNYRKEILDYIVHNAEQLTKISLSEAEQYMRGKLLNTQAIEGSLFYEATKLEKKNLTGTTGSGILEEVRRDVKADKFVVF